MVNIQAYRIYILTPIGHSHKYVFTTLPIGCPRIDFAASELLFLRALEQKTRLTLCQIQLDRVENDHSFTSADTQNLKSGKTHCGIKSRVQEKIVQPNNVNRSTIRCKCVGELTTGDVPHQNLAKVNPVGETFGRRKKGVHDGQKYTTGYSP